MDCIWPNLSVGVILASINIYILYNICTGTVFLNLIMKRFSMRPH